VLAMVAGTTDNVSTNANINCLHSIGSPSQICELCEASLPTRITSLVQGDRLYRDTFAQPCWSLATMIRRRSQLVLQLPAITADQAISIHCVKIEASTARGRMQHRSLKRSARLTCSMVQGDKLCFCILTSASG
jgi:hypothetical protein